MSTDLFGMAVENRKSMKELIIVNSPRVNYHPLPDAARTTIPAALFDNVELISLDKCLINGLIVCKHCHMLYTDARWNRPIFLNHLARFHAIQPKEPKPDPTIPKKPKKIPMIITTSPITVSLMEPNNHPRAQAAPQEAAQAGTHAAQAGTHAAQANNPGGALSHGVCNGRRSHLVKKSVPPPVLATQCVDTIYDPNYIPSTPRPLVIAEPDDWQDDWEPPIKKKPRSHKRKAAVMNDVKVADNKKANKKPEVGAYEAQHTTAKPNIEVREEDLKAAVSEANGPPPPTVGKREHAQGTSGKHAGRKELGW